MVSVELFSLPDFQAEFLNTAAYLENVLVLDYLFILVLVISEEKRSAHCLACATEDDSIFTSGIVTFYHQRQKKVSRPDVKIGSSSVAHARRSGALNVSLWILQEQG